MNSLKSTNALLHSSANDALRQFVSATLLESKADLDANQHQESGFEDNLQWIQNWPAKLNPKDYLQATTSLFTPSPTAINAVCLAHKFELHAIRFFALDKGAHLAALNTQYILAAEVFHLQSNVDHKFDLALKLSDVVLNYLAYWSKGLGSKGSKNIEAITEILSSKEPLEKKIVYLESNTAASFKQLDKARTKLTEMVEGQLTRRECQQQSARALREATQQLKLTPTCANFLSGPWYDGIQHIYLTEGDKSSVWKNSLATTQNIIKLFSEKTEDENDISFSELKNHIIKFLDPIQHTETEHLQWLDNLETEYWAIKKNLDITFDGELRLPNIDIGDSLELNISEKLIRKAKSYFEGDWFRFSGNYSGRSQILAISKNGHRYIFNNLNGQKTFDFSVKEFAYLLANGHAKEINNVNISDSLIEKIMAEAIRKISANATLSSPAKNVSIEASRNKAIAEAEDIKKRSQALEKNLERKEQSSREDKNRSDLEEKIRILEIEKHLLQMDLGQWITVNNEGEPLKLKLAVKLSSSNKYVFTNELGLGRHEFKSDELVTQILNNNIQLHTP